MKINIDDIGIKKSHYPVTIISLTPEDDKFLRENKLSPTKIMREAIKYLRENGFDEEEYYKRQGQKKDTSSGAEQ